MARLPVPALVLYAGLWLALAGIGHVAAWRYEVVPWGVPDPRILLVASWMPYCLAFIGYLSQAAGQALDDFRPALDLGEQQFSRLRYEFTILPARSALLANLCGVLLTLASVAWIPETSAPFMHPLSLAIISVAITAFGNALSVTALYQTFRLLRLIRHTYGRAQRLRLFQTSQLYAFSTLMLRMVVGWLIIIYTGILAYPSLLDNLFWATAAGLLVAGIGFSFVATLGDIHRRIRADKARQLDQVHSLLEEVFEALNQRIRDRETQDLDDLREAANALDLQRTVLSKVPTWPWQPGTLASFLTALTLPLLIWLAQAVISRLMGL